MYVYEENEEREREREKNDLKREEGKEGSEVTKTKGNSNSA